MVSLTKTSFLSQRKLRPDTALKFTKGNTKICCLQDSSAGRVIQMTGVYMIAQLLLVACGSPYFKKKR